ncbi:O-antigen ligase family protein [uncultured Marinobacter sp.]|uniref:O-antigen ligase family protein n=1 Tax=uncultured Marinobacter sp. TaxID=187379 RepID=UPI002602DBB5|nr:O-antigen ligase family protein [uncultured Marinobacter sp.]
MPKSNLMIQAFLLAGLGGALISSSFLAGATLLIAITGIVAIKRRTLEQTDWDTPKELRLIHFAFWFFVLVSAVAWIVDGFSYEGLKTLGTHARFILFWPLVIALTAAALKATGAFSAMILAAVAASVILVVDLLAHQGGFDAFLRYRFGGGINPITFGNITLLASVISWVACFHLWHQNRKGPALLALAIGSTGILIALLSQTRSNLFALPVLLLFFLALVPARARIPAILAIAVLIVSAGLSSSRVTDTIEQVSEGEFDPSIQLRLEAWQVAWNTFSNSPLAGAGLNSYKLAAQAHGESGDVHRSFLSCCTDHAHNDFLQAAATRGTLGILSWLFLLGIPFAVFARQLRNPHKPVACLAIAGAMLPAGYLTFGLTEATFDRSLFLTFYLLGVAAFASAMFNELAASYTRQRKVSVSATVITMNEEDHIEDCLKSARLVADEIIVLDSGSSDRTAEIARQYADVVEVTDWPGFGIQKQRALDKATGEWVLSLDADERITPELAREINHHLSEPDADAYKLPWAVTIYGKRLDFGRSGRAPLRLFRREGVSFSDALVHERILIPAGRKVKTLRGRLTHYTHRDFGHSLEKSAKYAWLGAREKHRKGKKTRTMIYPTLRGLLTFVQVYFIRFGFLDGAVGYLTAVTYAQVTFNKYAGLWTLGRNS